MNNSQTTPQQDIQAIREMVERLCKLGMEPMDGNSIGNVIAQDIRPHLAALEAKLSAPMKSEEEWAED